MIACALIKISFTVYMVLSLKYLINEAGIHPLPAIFYIIILSLFIGFIIQFASDLISNKLKSKLTARLIATIRAALLKNFKNISFNFDTLAVKDELLTAFTEDISRIELFCLNDLMPIISSLLLLTVTFIALLSLFWQMGIFIAIFMMLTVLLPIYFRRKINRSLTQHNEVETSLLSLIQEVLTNNIIISAYNVWHHFSARILDKINLASKTGYVYNEDSHLIQVSSMNLGLFSILLIVSIGGFAVIKGMVSVGSIFAFFLLYLYTIGSLQVITVSIPQFIKVYSALKRINRLINIPPNVVYKPNAIDLAAHLQSISFTNVSYQPKPDLKILHQLSFNIKMGQSIAFVGPSGSGKSIILKHLLRLHDASEGQITFDNQFEIKDISENTLREQMTIVMQESLLFNMSIHDNILMGRLDASKEEVIEAAKWVGLHKEITELPEAYDTVIGENGCLLSGGQRQRLSLARGLIRQSGFLLLDDVTSAVDAINEAEINASLLKLLKTKSLILATHRLNIVSHFDYIYVLNKGYIIDEGTHQDLLNTSTFYAESWRKQNIVTISDNEKISAIDIEYFKSMGFFKQFDEDFLNILVHAFQIENYDPNQVIFKQNSFGDKFYMIARGEVDVLKSSAQSTPDQLVATLSEGDYFGEIALLYNSPRNASIKTRSSCTLLTLTRNQFHEILNQNPLIKKRLELTAKKRSD